MSNSGGGLPIDAEAGLSNCIAPHRDSGDLGPARIYSVLFFHFVHHVHPFNMLLEILIVLHAVELFNLLMERRKVLWRSTYPGK
jgi:hypothetical protein